MGVSANAVTTNVIPQWDQKLLFKILDNIHDVVLVLDSDTTIVYANQAYASILGVDVSKVLGRRLDEIEPNAAAIRTMRAGKAEMGKKTFLESVGISVVGSTFPLYEGNRIIGCVSIFNNVVEIENLHRELQRSRGVTEYLREQLNQFEQLPLSFHEYIGQNSKLRETLLLAAKVAKSDSTVLIQGESGVGKEVLAKAVHNSSRRKDKPLIKVNCAAIPEALLESELFGFEDGAFTGAKKGGKLGKFELAHGGTIFLDEIGDMSMSMQAKLLRVIQEREFERVGGTKTIKIDIRIIAATNCDLEKMVEEETFRRDLFYRLNIVPLYLLPLRERKDDIPALASYFLSKFSQDLEHDIALSPEVLRVLKGHDWPGNIRELQNVLEHACVVCSGNEIEVQHLPSKLLATTPECQQLEIENTYGLKEAVAKVERELITLALLKNNNNRSHAMQALGISRRAFYEKLRRYNI